MTSDEIRNIVKDAVYETLQVLGIDVDDPLEVQKDFAHLRSWRSAVESVRSTSLVTAVGVFITGIIGLIYAKLHGSI